MAARRPSSERRPPYASAAISALMRCTVPVPTACSAAILCRPLPPFLISSRIAASVAGSIFGRPDGLPLLVPRLRARARPHPYFRR